MFSALAKGNGAWNGLTEWPDVDPSEVLNMFYSEFMIIQFANNSSKCLII